MTMSAIDIIKGILIYSTNRIIIHPIYNQRWRRMVKAA